jgi:hypothetical protein
VPRGGGAGRRGDRRGLDGGGIWGLPPGGWEEERRRAPVSGVLYQTNLAKEIILDALTGFVWTKLPFLEKITLGELNLTHEF